MHEPNFTNVIVNKLRIIASNSSALSFNSQNYFTFDIQILKQLLNPLLPNFNWVINLTLLCRKRSLHRCKIILPKQNVNTTRIFIFFWNVFLRMQWAQTILSKTESFSLFDSFKDFESPHYFPTCLS